MKSFLAHWNFKAGMMKGIKRFRLSWILCCIGAVFILLSSNEICNFSSAVEFFLIGYPLSAAVLAFVLQLHEEARPVKGLQIVLHLLWILYFIYLSLQMPLQNTYALNLAAMLNAVLLAGILYPFFVRYKAELLRPFMIGLLVSMGIVWLVAALLFPLLLAFSESLDTLFGTEWIFTVENNATVFFAVLCPLLFFSQMPVLGEDIAGEKWKKLFSVGRIALQGGVLPVLLLYMVALYVYLAKILLTWTLPVGAVSLPVSVLVAGMVLLEFFIGNEKEEEDARQRLTSGILRLLPWLTLPLLVLMSVGIAIRVADYGLTVSRLYALMFNLLEYLVIFLIIFSREKWYRTFLLVFAAAGLVSSVGPQSFSNIVRCRMQKEVVALAGMEKISLPLEKNEISMLREKSQTEQRRRLLSCADYLVRNYAFEEVDKVLTKEVYTYVNVVSVSDADRIYEYSADTLVNRKEYPYVRRVSFSGTIENYDPKKIIVGDNGPHGNYVLSEQEIKMKCAGNAVSWVLENKRSSMVVQEGRMTLYGDGYLFYDFEGLQFFGK